MYVDKDSIIMDGISIGQFLTQAEFGYNKLWSSDAGRNLAGTQKGTLIGIFPKLVLQFRKLNQEELHKLAPHFDAARQTIQYHDDNKGKVITMTTYSGDWKVTNKKLKVNEPFSCSFISTKKRS